MSQLPAPGSEPNAKTSVGGAIGGAGTGTLLVLLASNLPDNNPWKSWLVIIAPSVAVVINALYNLIKRQIDRVLEERRTQKAIEQAKETLRAAIKSKRTPPADRALYEADLADLERMTVQSDVARARAFLERRSKTD